MKLRHRNRKSRRTSVQRGTRTAYARRSFAKTRQRAFRYYDTEFASIRSN